MQPILAASLRHLAPLVRGGEYFQLFDIVLTIQTSTSPNIDPVVKIWMYNTIGRLFSARRSCNTTRIIGALHNNEYFALYSHYSRENLQLSNKRFVDLDNSRIRTPFSEFVFLLHSNYFHMEFWKNFVWLKCQDWS